jgi:hypothetical protein
LRPAPLRFISSSRSHPGQSFEAGASKSPPAASEGWARPVRRGPADPQHSARSGVGVPRGAPLNGGRPTTITRHAFVTVAPDHQHGEPDQGESGQASGEEGCVCEPRAVLEGDGARASWNRDSSVRSVRTGCSGESGRASLVRRDAITRARWRQHVLEAGVPTGHVDAPGGVHAGDRRGGGRIRHPALCAQKLFVCALGSARA